MSIHIKVSFVSFLLIFQFYSFIININRMIAEYYFSHGRIIEAVQQNPDEWKYKFFLSLQYKHDKDFLSSIDIDKELLKLNPYHINTMVNMGISYVYMGQLDNALKTWRQVLIYSPDNYLANNNIREINRLKVNQTLKP